MQRLHGHSVLAIGTIACLLAGCGPSLEPGGVPERTSHASHTHTVRLLPPLRPEVRSRPQGVPANVPERSQATVRPLAPEGVQNTSGVSMEARILVLSADGAEAGLPAIRQTLEYLGTPYTVWIGRDRPGQLTPDHLSSGTHAHYQGVILATGTLGYDDNGNWVSALTAAEWQNLWNFEAAFGVRQVSWYTYPTPDFGYGWPTETDTETRPIPLQFTPAGRQLFSYMNPSGGVLAIQGAWTYLAKLKATDATPLLMDSQGNTLMAIKPYPDGRECLVLTFDNAPYLKHSIALGYGVVNWLTRGIFLGERRVYMSAQIDDLFIPDEMWSGGELRITGEDLRRTAEWQRLQHAINPLTRDFVMDQAFNGVGAEWNYLPGDTLIPASIELGNEFKWISHTYTHPYLTSVSYSTAYREFSQNNKMAASLKLPGYSVRSIVTPNVTGLYNVNAMTAARDTGIKYLVSDTSVRGEENPYPNCGKYNDLVPSIFQIPRRPNNLFYNVATPAEWASEYNFLYRDYWGRDLSYQEILHVESEMLLMYLLKGENDPWMYHQPNLYAYDGTHSLLSDLLDMTIDKYLAFYNLPILSPTQDGLGLEVENRTNYIAAKVTAVISKGAITFRAKQNAIVPVTGLYTPDALFYGGQHISFIPVTPGQAVVVPLQSEATFAK